MRVRYFQTASGRVPVAEYIRGLPLDRRAEVLATVRDIELHGLEGASVTMRHIDGKLWEVKLATDRIFYVVVAGPGMVLLHAYKKQGQKAPPRELDTARRRMRAVLKG